MRIGIDMRMAGTGEGIGRYCEELVRHLAEIDHENEYFLISSSQFPIFNEFSRRYSSPVSWEKKNQASSQAGIPGYDLARGKAGIQGNCGFGNNGRRYQERVWHQQRKDRGDLRGSNG